MEEKRKRGRPRKAVQLPQEILNIVNEVEAKQKQEEEQEIKEIVQEIRLKRGDWDVRIGDPIPYFDSTLSYELTGYKPITATQGLDFDPNWFIETRETFKKTGHYCSFKPNTKAYNDFWTEQYIRCRDGMTVNGYTITGDNYFFLNFYQLMDLTSATKAGSSRNYDFPSFFVKLYEYFHYIELCKQLRKNAIGLKARGVGFSEIGASIVVNTYNCRRNSVIVVAALLENYLTKTLSKCWKLLDFLNDYTDGGFFKLRLVKDTELTKKASVLKIVNGQKVESGWMSEINGINADKPGKIRGDRTDLLIYEESGCFIAGTKVVMYDGTIKNIEDVKVGDKVMGDDGTCRNVLETHTGSEMMYKITPRNGDVLIVNENHIIYGKYRNYSKGTYEDFKIKAKDYYNMIKSSPRKADNYKLIKYKTSQLSTFKIEPYKVDNYYGFSLDGNHLFLLEDFTIVHNSWPKWKKAFEQGDALVGIQGSKFGIKMAWGTGR